MDLLHIGIDLNPKYGGIYSSVRAFTAAQKDLGARPRVINFGDSGEPVSGIDCPCTHVSVVKLPVLRRYRFWNGFWSDGFARLAGAPDTVFIHGAFYHAAAAAAAYFRARRIPYYFVSHGSLDPYVFSYRSIRKLTWMRLFRSRLLAECEATIFATEQERRRASNWTRGRRTEVLLFPTRLVDEYDKDSARTELLLQHGLSPNLRVILFTGRLDVIKRPVETIRAFKAACRSDWVLILVGPSVDPSIVLAVEQACRQPGPHAVYAGAVYGDALDAYYQAADLFILLSRKENFSHVTAEALAHGVPAVLSEGVNLRHELESINCTWTVTDAEIENACAHERFSKILALPQSELLAAGKRGRNWVRTNLSAATFGRRMHDLLERRHEGRISQCAS